MADATITTMLAPATPPPTASPRSTTMSCVASKCFVVRSSSTKPANSSSHIKCGPCGKYKDRLQYSNKQLQEWDARKRRGRGPVEGPKCRSCTGQPQTEWECSQCEKVLPKDKFAKSQRNKKEHAVSGHRTLRFAELMECLAVYRLLPRTPGSRAKHPRCGGGGNDS